jgi:hypothetical protein
MYLIIAKYLSIILTQRVFNPESNSGLKTQRHFTQQPEKRIKRT